MPGSHSKKDKLKKRVARKGFSNMDDINRKRAPKKKVKTLKVAPERVGPNNDLQKSTFEPHEGMYLDKKEIKRQDMAKLKKKIAKIRKADQQDINRVKRWNSRSFNKKKELSGPTEKTFKNTYGYPANPTPKYPNVDPKGKPYPGVDPHGSVAKLKKRIAKVRKADGGVAPNYNNPSKIRKKKTATKTAAGMANIGKKPWMQKDYLKKKGKHLEKTALRSNVNKGVNKVNPIKPTKTYKDTINPQEEDPDRIKQNATTIGRGNPSHFGKTRKARKKIRIPKGVLPKGKSKGDRAFIKKEEGEAVWDDIAKKFGDDPGKEFGLGLKGDEREKFLEQKEDLMKDKEAYESSVIRQPSKHRPKKPTQQDRIDVLEARKRIARIRKAGEQVDPRVKKRKTVRPDSPVQKVAIKKINTPHILDIGKHSAPMGRQRIPPSRVRPKSGDSDFTSVIKNRERKYKQHSKMPKYDPKKTG